MTADMLDLARRAVASPRWEWRAGKLTSHGARCLGRDLWVDRGQRVAVFADPNEGEVPDLTDPATLGCLLALVREAWGLCVTTAYRFTTDGSSRWVWAVQSEPRDYITPSANPPSAWIPMTLSCGATEAEALVAALEAAPR